MKKYSVAIRRLRERDNKIVKFFDNDSIISSEEFNNEFRGYIEDIARFKKSKGRKFLRSTEYGAIGILDMNDIYQEAYLAFLEAYNKFMELDAKGSFNYQDGERGAAIWTYIKKTTALNFEQAVRGKKDGIRVTHHAQFVSKSTNMNLLTSLFGGLETRFANNVMEVGLTKWETDLVGYFLEVHMDEYLDLTRDGNRDFKKNERAIVKALYGIDQSKMTYKEISEYYGVGQSTIRSVKERAIKRLQSEESKEKIANFLHEYRISTQADTEKYRNI